MEFLYFLSAIVMAAWGLYLASRVSLPLLGFTVLALGTVFGPYFFTIQGPIGFSVDRILWFAMLAIFVARLTMRRTRPIRLGRLDWIAVLLVGWLLVSTQMGESPPGAFILPLARWFFCACIPLGMYFVARFSYLSRQDLRRIHIGLITLGLYLAATALAEKFGFYALVFPKYIADPDPAKAAFFGRGRGPLLNPAGNGVLLTLALAAILIAAHHGTRLRKALCLVAAILSLGGVYATLTRCVWIGAVAAMGIINLNRFSRRVRIWVAATTVLAVSGALVGFGDELLYLKRDKRLSASASVKSIELRPMLAILAWEMFQDHPIAGIGYGHYYAYKERYAQENKWDMPLRKAVPYMQHNVILSYLVDTGLIGAGLFVLLLIGWGMRGWQIACSTSACVEARNVGLMMLAMLAGYLCNGMFQDVSVIPMMNAYLFYLAGLTIAVDSLDGKLPALAPRKARMSRKFQASSLPEPAAATRT